MDLLLKGIVWYDGKTIVSGDIRIGKGMLLEIGSPLPIRKGEQVADFTNHYLYPGLINAHDHLEMNLYSHLGTPPYTNYVEWAKDIYQPAQSPLREIESANIDDRLLWGGLKNLISGVTTVVHHNPWHRILGRNDFPVKVLKQIAWAHSLALGVKIQKAFPKKRDTPFVIHAAEGIDALAFAEVAKLNNLSLIKSNTVLVHAIALNESDQELLSDRASSVVWCPASNLFMFNQTAPIQQLKDRLKVALGSDSTLTGSATLLDEMKVAFHTGLAGSQELYNMVTGV